MNLIEQNKNKTQKALTDSLLKEISARLRFGLSKSAAMHEGARVLARPLPRETQLAQPPLHSPLLPPSHISSHMLLPSRLNLDYT